MSVMLELRVEEGMKVMRFLNMFRKLFDPKYADKKVEAIHQDTVKRVETINKDIDKSAARINDRDNAASFIFIAVGGKKNGR